MEARNKLGRFDNLFQFCENVDLRLLNKRVIESLVRAGAMDSMGSRRSQLLAVLDRAMECGQQRQRAAESGQHGLFGGGDEPGVAPPIDMPDVPELPEADRLAGEKESHGLLRHGPSAGNSISALLREVTQHTTSAVDELPHECPITLGGILTQLRIRPSRKGALWAAATLEDLRGNVDLLVFPQTLQQVQNVLKPDAALLIKGRVRHDENSRPKVVVSNAKPLEAALNGKKPAIWIRVNPANVSAELLGELQNLLSSHPGKNPVLFEVERPGDFRALVQPQNPGVADASEELLSHLRRICGDEAIRVERRAKALNRA